MSPSVATRLSLCSIYDTSPELLLQLSFFVTKFTSFNLVKFWQLVVKRAKQAKQNFDFYPGTQKCGDNMAAIGYAFRYKIAGNITSNPHTLTVDKLLLQYFIQ